MRKSYSIASARAELADIIDQVEAGRDVEIVRRGKQVAVLVSPARYARMSGERLRFGDAYAAFMRRHDAKGFGVDADFETGLRDRSVGRTVKL